ncbi:MAG: peptidoglycan DD-metalloendopeptidase family protein [bacterium]|nr:peptidoglycan DD-metalloendopeptidase family protein [bacterium]
MNEKNTKQISKIFLVACLVAVFFSFLSRPTPLKADDSVIDLNQKIQENKSKMNELQKQSDALAAKVRSAQKQAVSLQNQIGILDSSIEETQIDIQTKNLEVEQLELELALTESKIGQENGRLNDTKEKIAGLLRQLNRYNEQKSLAIFVNYSSFSQIFDELHRSEILNNSLYDQLRDFKKIKSDLEENQKMLSGKKDEAAAIKQQLDEIKLTLEEEMNLKKRLFGNTKATEAEFQKSLATLRAQEAAIDSEIVTLEKNIRQKMQIADDAGGGAGGKLSWPLNPSRGISAVFHDPDYPFRYLFEHTGIDVRVYQGTPIVAAASGYVAKTFNGGMSNKPSYIMILHANNLASVYMHVSSINVGQDTYVTRGQIIGASGGMPGTAGAGVWTTGPHLHFEVRSNSVPVNPLSYLP